MDKFIICFKEDIKDKLIKKGFKLISSNPNANGNKYTFENTQNIQFAKDLDFSGTEVVFTNRMTF